MIGEELTKVEKKEMFFQTMFELFSTLFILPLCCQNHQFS
jgi:hypothetical protein